MPEHLGKRSVLSTTPLVRWCQQRLHRIRSPVSGEQIHYLTRAEKRASDFISISPPSSPPPRYETLLDHQTPGPRISHIPADWQHTMGPKNSVLRRTFQPDENPFRRDQISVY